MLEAACHSFGLIGHSEKIEGIHGLIERASQTLAPVLIWGESGTGKEFIARAIHGAGPHKNDPFIKVCCASFREDLLDHELYDHAKGIEKSNQGTLFLDEIETLSLSSQAKLLAVLKQQKFGIHCRLITSAHQDLEPAVKNKKIREDFYYFISIISLNPPPLRERCEDIPLFANYFIERFNQENGRKIKDITDEAMSCLFYHLWPGNINELENVINRACILCSTGTLSLELFQKIDFPPKPVHEKGRLPKAVAELERHMIKTALRRSGGNQRQAAQSLGITERMLGYKLKRYGYK